MKKARKSKKSDGFSGEEEGNYLPVSLCLRSLINTTKKRENFVMSAFSLSLTNVFHLFKTYQESSQLRMKWRRQRRTKIRKKNIYKQNINIRWLRQSSMYVTLKWKLEVTVSVYNMGEWEWERTRRAQLSDIMSKTYRKQAKNFLFYTQNFHGVDFFFVVSGGFFLLSSKHNKTQNKTLWKNINITNDDITNRAVFHQEKGCPAVSE